MVGLWVLMASCQTRHELQGYGVAKGFEAYVPARIALAPCHLWPAAGEAWVGTNLDELCRRGDQAVAAGFDQQPYLQGLSPALVEQLFVAEQQADWLKRSTKIWSEALIGCPEQSPGPLQYQRCVANKSTWQVFLSSLGTITRNSDALLLPLVITSFEKRWNDRGITNAQRSASLELLLVATHSGELLWSGKGEGTVTSKQASGDGAYPSWERVYEHLFSPVLWKDFPGRKR
jgi:hypothetical protein